MELYICKVIALIVLLVTSFIAAFLPLKIRKISKLFRNDKRDTITTVIQCFGGGLLLGTALILILPEVNLTLNEAYTPLAEVLLSAGFFGLYLIKELSSFVSYSNSALSVFSQDPDDQDEEDQDENENVEQNESGIDTVDEGPEEPQTPPKFNDISLDAITSSPESDPSANESFSSFNPKYAGSLNTSTQSMFPNYKPNVEASKVQRSTLKHNFQLPKINLKLKTDKTDSSEKRSSFKVPKKEVVAISLLSLNAFFEGLVIGLGTSELNLWQLFSVLLVHQLLMSLSIGLEMTQGKSNLQLNVFLISIFSLAISIGVGIGIGISATESLLNLLIIKGVACGALFYAFLEVIHVEKCRTSVSGLLQFGALLFGFIITVLIKILSSAADENDILELNNTNTTDLPPPIIG
eukprot:07825.XXX_31619_29896_1 [CDS] Oithona nana genome sequencing.